MAVALTTIRTDIYTNIFNHLQSDGTYAITTNNIHPNFNSKQMIEEGYPQVIIKEPTVSMGRIGVGPTAPLRSFPFKMEIEIHHNSSASVKSVVDEVMNSIISGNSALRADGLYQIQFDEDDREDTEYQENRTVYVYTLMLMGVFMVKG